MTDNNSKDLDATMQAFLDNELVEEVLQQHQETPLSHCNDANPAIPEVSGKTQETVDSTEPQGFSTKFRQEIAAIASTVLKIPSDRLDVKENMARYGVDSIIVTEIIKRISDLLDLPIAPTVFFEARNLQELADILYRRYRGTVEQLYQEPVEDVQYDTNETEIAETTENSQEAGTLDDIENEVNSWIDQFKSAAASAETKVQATSPTLSESKITSVAAYEPVAIIAMDGLFANSANLQQFEQHLRNGDDCISEVPVERWDWRQIYGDPQQGEFTQVKYGGFAPDIDKFDPLFFGMSPKEAELMDPQHRLFIQCVWRLIESAGYAPSSLSGRKVGLFLGINLQDYAHQVARSGAMDALHLTSHGHMFCPNRLSFLLDIHGPSQVIDTACSSSLVALHRAVLSIQHEGCEMAIAGGSNLLISPDMHIMYSKVGMICEDGRCKTFSDQANGYARGDGVGAVLLKSLSQAEKDGDRILAVIRGSSENHGGLSTSLTAPNPKAQAALIVEAHQKAGIDPRSIGYIECHGTGTALGDPIEINGLKMAFQQLYQQAGVAMPEQASCALGSVKSNIGHAETAAGIAGVIKTILSIQNKQLYPSLHCDVINPMIELDGSPFFILQKGQDWCVAEKDGKTQPRRAGVSSFGAGGSNAHVVIEEYIEQASPAVQQAFPSLILLSAKNNERLSDSVTNLLSFLQHTSNLQLPDIAYTLQLGREAMKQRLAIIVSSVEELMGKLEQIVHGHQAVEQCYQGNINDHKQVLKTLTENEALPNNLSQWFADGQMQHLAEYWIKGVHIDWQTLYRDTPRQGRAPRRVFLPTYPFARKHCWLPAISNVRPEQQTHSRLTPNHLHPLLQINSSDLSGCRFSSVFTGDEFFLADHVVMENKVLPAVAYLEMARAAMEKISPTTEESFRPIRLNQVVWARPFSLDEQSKAIHISLASEPGDQTSYRIYSQTGSEVEAIVHSQGLASFPSTGIGGIEETARLNLEALRQSITGGEPENNSLSAEKCYQAFNALGIHYGAGHQGLDKVYYSAPNSQSKKLSPQVLAKLRLPASEADNAPQYLLHPGLIDSALQACIGLLAAAGQSLLASENGKLNLNASLPFALDEITVLVPPSSDLWVWIRYAEGSSPGDKVQKLDIDLSDDQGQVCVAMKGFSSRSVETAPLQADNACLFFKPVWLEQTVAESIRPIDWSQHHVVVCDIAQSFPASVVLELESNLPGVNCHRLNLEGDIESLYQQAAIKVFELLKQALVEKISGYRLFQVVVPSQGQGTLLHGLSGLLQTVNRENTKFHAQLIELDKIASVQNLVSRLKQDSTVPHQMRIRYQGDSRQYLQWQEAVEIDSISTVPWKDKGIYLITGGNGGLAMLFAQHIAIQSQNASIILCGRSALTGQKQALVNKLKASGLHVDYRLVDVSKRKDVDALIEGLHKKYGRLDGVLHCAGLLQDNFIVRKTAAEFDQVLAPKVTGTINLDRACAQLQLDFFVLFSSSAGALGSAGQADYACANGFLDAYAQYRNRLVERNQRYGHTVAINWPLWAEGGMRMEANALAMMRQNTGMEPLSTENGKDAFNRILLSGAEQMMVLQGSPARIRSLLKTTPVNIADNESVKSEPLLADSSVDNAQLQAKIAQMLLKFIAELMKFDLDDLDVDSELSEYGFDSITLTDFSNQLNRRYQLQLTPTVFFEYSTITDLAAWLATEYASVFADEFGLTRQTQATPLPVDQLQVEEQQAASVPRVEDSESRNQQADIEEKVEHSSDAVAIIGISGRFPMADDLDQFWCNLERGKDCISEIPQNRWDWRSLFGDPKTEANKTNIKWGGFINGVADFDARFFGISPREAELMDPQQRLLMQYVWKVIEDAGYSAASLSGTNTGIFIGTASSGYGELMAKSGAEIESYSSTGVVGSVGPNRMSYFLNLHGPSEPIETACSSSLVAIHRALSAIKNGDCEQAIVGGINLIISPETHISFNKAGMLCQDGRCKTFSDQANGYVRGEGIGMLFLKKLSLAEQGGDHIYAVIRGSAENHGGRGNSLTAPNPKAQAALIKDAYHRAGIDPRTVGYIEAHGTGTELGDPIEINGLKSAFKDLYQDTGSSEINSAHCALGAVKTNIGHLELAAGVAGVIKVLLQLKHKTLVKSLHCEQLNPYVQLSDSPFYLLQENHPWLPLQDKNGREVPRRAGISSFGFGGVNAHIVLEEYIDTRLNQTSPDYNQLSQLPSLVVLSAKTTDQLQRYASLLLDFISTKSVPTDNKTQSSEDHSRLILQDKVRTLISGILHIDAGEIELNHELDEYGFDLVNQAMLLSDLQEQFDLEIAPNLVVKQPTIISIVDQLLQNQPELHQYLQQQDDLVSVSAMPESAEVIFDPGFSLRDLAYTSQVGREVMEQRLAIMVDSFEELAVKLSAFVNGQTDTINDLFCGQVNANKSLLSAFTGDDDLQEVLAKWIKRGKFNQLLDLWVKGLNIDWEKLYGESGVYPFKPRRISIPGYPFSERRYWFQTKSDGVKHSASTKDQLHPLLQTNISTLQQCRFNTIFNGDEFFLADHRVQGQKLLPGVVYLEMARAAATMANDQTMPATMQLDDVVWIQPMVVEQPVTVDIELNSEASGLISYQIVSRANTVGGHHEGTIVHCQGKAIPEPGLNSTVIDVNGLIKRLSVNAFDTEHCYALFQQAGLDYGPAQRGLNKLYCAQGEVLARLILPESVRMTENQYTLHPSLMDAALQSSIGLSMLGEAEVKNSEALKTYLPFAIKTVLIFRACEPTMWAWLRHSPGSSTDDRVQKFDIDICNDQGQVCIQIKEFSVRVLDTSMDKTDDFPVGNSEQLEENAADEEVTTDVAQLEVERDHFRAEAIDYFRDLLASTLKSPVEDITVYEGMDKFGIDSMMVMELTSTLEKTFGVLSKTLFFEYQTLAELVDYFIEHHSSQLLQLLKGRLPASQLQVTANVSQRSVQTQTEKLKPDTISRYQPLVNKNPDLAAMDIAIIGLSGRYPMADDIEIFWHNLREGRNCISEVPKQRWDWHEFYSKDRTQAGRHYSKWGGFIEDVDKFDPLFFNISPREAEYMDPQERLFLEHAWMALEDSGYRREDLQQPLINTGDALDLPAQVGVYAGVMYGEYQLFGLEASLKGQDIATASFYASIANRVSYFLNLHGPSMSVDTMCSSSLTAIHLACQDLKLGRTNMALAGGVNLSIHPNKYKILSSGQFISSSGQCQSFGAGGDGYIPGEGVGVVMLKRLADAERDGDHIYGVIKSTALNHGGKTNSFSVPNPNAQQMVISRALRESGIDPRAINYIEAHGTGTSLGDPIEITGLSKAFAQYGMGMQSCWIGSVKSNIGHCESAAGMAGLSKVLLQMREGKIAPSLHSEQLNPNIDFSVTPFRVNQQLRDWPRRVVDGRTQARVAGISSFGAGGSNAHLLIQEYIQADKEVNPSTLVLNSQTPYLIILSARSEQQLRHYAERLLQFVQLHQTEKDTVFLRDLAYTLQLGREAMQQRLGFVVGSVNELSDKLRKFLQAGKKDLHIGRVKHNNAAVMTGQMSESVLKLLSDRQYDDLLAAWVQGDSVDWRQLYIDTGKPPKRVSLPTYPFDKQRYWLEMTEATDFASDHQQTLDSMSQTNLQPVEAENSGLLLLTPNWQSKAVEVNAAELNYGQHKVLFTGSVIEIPGVDCYSLESVDTETAGCFTDYAIQLFEQVQAIFRSKPAGSVLLQIVSGTGEGQNSCPDSLISALVALLKTAQMENPQFIGQFIELEWSKHAPSATELQQLLLENGKVSSEQYIRYQNHQRQVLNWVEPRSHQQANLPVWKQGGIYLITGGLGGLGLLFAHEIVRQVSDVTLILTGRSALDEARTSSLEALQKTGAQVQYQAVDVSDRQAVEGLIESVKQRYGVLNGIIHSAGIIQDNFIVKKSSLEFRQVLAAKVSGVVNLDLASRGQKLDFFILFSSITGALGNIGQADYATANAFMDAYAAYRNRLSQQALTATSVSGHCLSINWPLWQQGGMNIDPKSKDMMWRRVGLKPLLTEEGITAFYRGLDLNAEQLMVLSGDQSRLRQGFNLTAEQLIETDLPTKAENRMQAVKPDAQQWQTQVETLLIKTLCDLLKLPVHQVEVDVPIEQYGIDSVAMMTLTNELEKTFGALPKTLFFEYPCIDSISSYLIENYPQVIAAMEGNKAQPEAAISESTVVNTQVQVEPSPIKASENTKQNVDTDIAVIGMSGRFPMANDLETFWKNLAEGKDCISEIPEQRWDNRAFFDSDKNKAGKSYCKWGGFLDQVELFDPLFFKISPKEAALLDPQERLFLETVWNLLEASGYLGETLDRLCQSKVGVFAGSMSQQYHAFEAGIQQESVVALSSHSSIANRVSYFFNFQGPSVAIDTMCSSSLTAVHMACDSLHRGDCKVAIAGGVNLSIHPKKFIALSAGQIVGSHANSTSFGEGDGYLPAEAVGAVLLKPLSAAIADNDNIIGVIKSSATNHSGQSNGYSVPNGSAQTELISDNFARSGIDARTVTYVESAANGSPLGDAIELNALSASFARNTDDKQFCSIGSVKSNIGHAEAASGITQLIKVLLQLQHRQLVPHIKAQPVNPDIDFNQTPFRLQRKLETWQRPVLTSSDGQQHEYPLRASISSFGAGGSNAHLIVEEYHPGIQVQIPVTSVTQPLLMLFSAKSAKQLHSLVRSISEFIAQHAEISLADMAYTLQTARVAMEYRMAMVVQSREQLLEGLQRFLQPEADESTNVKVYTGNHEQDNSEIKQLLSGHSGRTMLQLLLEERDLEKLALYWVKGSKVIWQSLYDGETVRRIPLPTYPFERKRYWLTENEPLDCEAPCFVYNDEQSLQDNVLAYLKYTLSNFLEVSEHDISTSKNLLDYGVDSMFSSQLRRDFERLFQVKITARDLLEHNSLSALAELIAQKTQQVKKNSDDLSVVGVDKGQKHLPLSEGQKGLWFLHQSTADLSAYNIPMVLKFGAGLQLDVLKRACDYLWRQHPILRSCFIQDRGELYRISDEDAQFLFEHSKVDLAEESDVIESFLQKSKKPFDLKQGGLFRVYVQTMKEGGQHYVLFTLHHIIFDGSSALLLVQSLLKIYQQLIQGQSVQIIPEQESYDDFVHWQQNFLASEQGQAQLHYWRKQLSGEIPVLSLPFTSQCKNEQQCDDVGYELTLTLELAEKVRQLSQMLQINPSVIFLGTLKMLLHRYSGESDIAIGMPTAGRPDSVFEQTIGYFINMIVIRSHLNGKQDCMDFLRQLQFTVADGLDHADYPFPALLSQLAVEREHQASPLFQVLYAYQNFIPSKQLTELFTDGQNLPDSIEFVSGVNQGSSYELELEVYPTNNSFLLKLDYDDKLFRSKNIDRLIQHYLNLLDSVCTQPEKAVAEHTLLSTNEYRQLVNRWNSRKDKVTDPSSVVELFQRQAALTPEQTALSCQKQRLSYQALDSISSKMANYLLSLDMLAPGDGIGVYMDRGIQMIVAMLAVFKAQGIYIPIAPDCPDKRIQHMLSDSGMKLILGKQKMLEAISSIVEAVGCHCLAVDHVNEEMLQTDTELSYAFDPQLPAYIIYTSGSTGMPKGVMIPHSALSHHCQVMRDYYQLQPEAKVLQFSSINVDASLEQMLPALLAGASVIIRPDQLWSPVEFRGQVEEHALSVVDLPPAYLHELLLATKTEAEWRQLSSIQVLITGGEALLPETVDLWRSSAMNDCRLINAYGPTETTITSTVYAISRQTPESEIKSNVPIGRALPGESIYLLDAYHQPVPIGVPGELYIGGKGLALGYLNQVGLTAQKFIENPFEADSKLYQTGDMARWLEDGNIQFLGRRDQQVKIRGYRVECGEIESAILALDGIKQALVLAETVNGNIGLQAFVVPSTEQKSLSESVLKKQLAMQLPDYMIPTNILILDEMPLLVGGKVDRKALMLQLPERMEIQNLVPARTPLEKQLVEIWQQVLELDQVGIYDDFFAIGGHSLLSVRLMAVIQKRLGKELSIASLFQAPDIATQAKLLENDQSTSWSPLVCLQPEGDKSPLFFIHAVAGNVLCYQPLVQCLDKQRPIYGLQAPEKKLHPETITGLARYYIGEIQKTQANGPYYLAGWSMGGVIAYEIARQLFELGEQVASLAMIESYTPDIIKMIERDSFKQVSDQDSETLLLMTFLTELGVKDIDDLVLASEAMPDVNSRLENLLEDLLQFGLLTEDTDIDQLRALFNLYTTNVKAMEQYQPGTYTGKVNLLFAEKSQTGFSVGKQTLGGWESLVLDAQKVIYLPGDHYSIMQAPQVRLLADEIKGIMHELSN